MAGKWCWRLCRGAGSFLLNHVVWAGPATWRRTCFFNLTAGVRDAAILDHHLSGLRTSPH
jgi:hypothetical protein